jgi:hypothetical protein
MRQGWVAARAYSPCASLLSLDPRGRVRVPTCSGLFAIVRGPIRNTNQESARTAFKRSEEKFDRVKLWGKRKGQSDLLKQSLPKPHSDCVAGKMQIIAVARDEGRSKTYDALERDGGDAAYALWSTRSDVR